MYRPGPSTEELELLGLTAEDVQDDSVQEVWAENWDTFQIFSRLGTQWRVGMNGVTGMDYSMVISPGGLFDLMRIQKKKRLTLLDDLHTMEIEAIHQLTPKKS